ncbi:RICIN domain-containing protein [Alkalitalea saponilacus]|uniref:Por secretion system C-terminal sorting domain-containing protein n=1 Tax=Alkalitalea saponilacus TaxID=889453 RepID=A0A1T5A9W1_9BACT|nr:RICIN domain-containing protein [Alkalitalea saponilacus]ASB48785.1 hypothetical protein CDL62_06395 [Alkalitalea saponilacus]SKB31517.1 Por secretion system C-terminal sorting domain-containing protein [Alkalitalea saponilacus]
MKLFRLLILLLTLNLLPSMVAAWPGMELPPLHVDGRYLKDPCGNNVLLHGVAITPSPWFNGCMYGNEHCRWENYDVQGCLNYNFAIINRLTDTSDGWYLNYIRLHIDPYWTNDPGPPISEHDISRFNFNRLVQYTDEVIIPLINHAHSRGLYVVLRPPGVCPERISVGDAYQQYLTTVWDFLSQHPQIRNADHVMFEIANEPVEILGTNGVWGGTSQAHFDALVNYFQPIVDLIRNNGANNICWIPGTGWQSHYAGYANNPITGGNIGYAVHIYPGYWGGIRNYQDFLNGWNVNVKPVADIAPIIITETDWAPQSYKDAGHYVWGIGNTGVAGGQGFGANFKYIVDQSGNVSWNVLAPENLIHMGDPNGATAYNNDWEAVAAPVKQWFSEYAAGNIPTSNCEPLAGCSGNVQDGIYTISAKHSNKCLDVYNFSMSDGGNIVQWSCGNTENQQWLIQQNSEGYYSIRSLYSDKCLDVANWSTNDGANIQQWSCNGQEVQQFCLQSTGDGYYTIVNRNSGKCIDITDFSMDDGANVQQWTCYNNDCQQFALTPVTTQTIANGTYSIQNRNSGQALDSYNLGTSDGTNLVQWPGTGQTNQQWTITHVENDFYRISPVHAPTKALDVIDYSSADGANVQLWEYWGGTCQQWRFIDVGNGYFQIEARHSGKLLEVAGASLDNGANVQQWPANNHHCQHWILSSLRSASLLENEVGSDNETALEVQVFPNPVTDGNVTIVLPKTKIDASNEIIINIMNLQGSTVYSTKICRNHSINISLNLIQGLYILEINDGDERYVQKLIIK